MEFCPNCTILLLVESAGGGRRLRVFCPVCPYVCSYENKLIKKHSLVKKELESIFSGDSAMKYAPKTSATCPSCHRQGEAYFRQMQIRSADEPMTTFYQCCDESCHFEWRED